jgi:hypothetical protein
MSRIIIYCFGDKNVKKYVIPVLFVLWSQDYIGDIVHKFPIIKFLNAQTIFNLTVTGVNSCVEFGCRKKIKRCSGIIHGTGIEVVMVILW